MTWKWYITIAAVREWMRITGRRGEPEANNPAFLAAQDELGQMSLTFKISAAATENETPGNLVYRGKVTLYGKRRKVECDVSLSRRSEGELPQLVRVRLK